jgi:hypothetical protein
MPSRLAALLLAMATLPALAQDPCAAEAARSCDRAKGETALLECLRRVRELSPACQAQLTELAGIAKELGEDCEADARRLCAEVQPGQGRLMRCLKDHESFLSQSCQGAINGIRLVRSSVQAGCAGDVGRFCKMVPEGGGRIIGCLREHEKELTSDCRDVLKKLP